MCAVCFKSVATNMPVTTKHFPQKFRALVFSLAWIVGCATAWAESESHEQPSVTPYRPSVSTPAELSAPGWLEIEGGVSLARADGNARRDSLPYTIKLAFTSDWGVRIGGDAWVRQTDETGQQPRGVGDSSIVLKRRFAVSETSAFGLEAGANLPTGHKGISNGKPDYLLNGIYSADLGAYHADLNLALTRIGNIPADAGRTQTLWAASLSKTLNERWSLGSEISGTRQRGVDSTKQLLLSASYGVSKSLVLDAGVSRSLRSGVSDWSVFTGFTVLAGRVF
jgi:hypothetical protein